MAGGSDAAEPASPWAAVLLLDQSRSMAERGHLEITKAAAIALSALIRTQYPRVALYVVLFTYYAQEIKPEELPSLTRAGARSS
jgi:uncharacterized protein with von Willebrand factor type A (vWA) domain